MALLILLFASFIEGRLTTCRHQGRICDGGGAISPNTSLLIPIQTYVEGTYVLFLRKCDDNNRPQRRRKTRLERIYLWGSVVFPTIQGGHEVDLRVHSLSHTLSDIINPMGSEWFDLVDGHVNDWRETHHIYEHHIS